MTRDFIEELRQACDKEGVEFIFIMTKDWNDSAFFSTNVENLKDEYKYPNGRKTTKRESIVECLEFCLKDNE